MGKQFHLGTHKRDGAESPAGDHTTFLPPFELFTALRNKPMYPNFYCPFHIYPDSNLNP